MPTCCGCGGFASRCALQVRCRRAHRWRPRWSCRSTCRRGTSMPPDRGRRDRECGVALVMVLLVTGLLTALGLGAAMLTIVETWLSASHRTSSELTYAADAVVARAVVDLRGAADWTPALSSSLPAGASTFNDGVLGVRLDDGRVV